ncbi:MAG: glycosyltransferase [Nocardioidaceae bacterium]
MRARGADPGHREVAAAVDLPGSATPVASLRDVVHAIGVVVPAHNEQAMIGGCLAAINAAAGQARSHGIAVCTVVVADDCTDATASVAQANGALVVRLRSRRVGEVRDAGARRVLRQYASVPANRLWLAHTDADSRVSPRWLLAQTRAARSGAQAFLGTVALDPADPAFSDLHWRWVHQYALAARVARTHGHVHGANFGVRADAYLAAGGFAAKPLHEDRLLVQRLKDVGAVLAWIDDEPVCTSARLTSRTPGGVSADLRAL